MSLSAFMSLSQLVQTVSLLRDELVQGDPEACACSQPPPRCGGSRATSRRVSLRTGVSPVSREGAVVARELRAERPRIE